MDRKDSGLFQSDLIGDFFLELGKLFAHPIASELVSGELLGDL